MNKCIYSDVCGGCTYQGLSYNKQLDIKNEKINNLLSSFAKPNKILGMKDPSSYRNKIQVTFGKDEKGHIIYGNYVEKTHIIVPINECSICDKEALNIIKTINKLILKYKISIFDERKYKGCIRHILIRTNHNNEHMVIIITGNTRLPKINSFINDLLKKHKSIISIIQSINDKRTSLILGNKSFILYGDKYITDKLCGNTYKIGPNSFYQINKTMTKVLYDYAIKLACLKGNENVLDAYCGIGTISLLLAKKCKRVVGVEINKEAIKDAVINKKINNIDNAYFVAEDATKFILSNKEKYDLVFIDPPRSGCDKRFLNSIIKIKPKTVIYISCNPVTLKRDLAFLTKNKHYKVEDIQPVDMFPYTEHIETIVKLNSI